MDRGHNLDYLLLCKHTSKNSFCSSEIHGFVELVCILLCEIQWSVA